MQVSHIPAQRSNRDQTSEQTLVHVHHFKPRLCPDLPVFLETFHAETPQPRHCRRLSHELFEAYPRQRGRVCHNCEQHKSRQKQNPQKSTPLHIAHFTPPLGRRSPRSCPN